MTIQAALQEAHTRLKKLNLPLDTSWSEAEILLAHVIKRDRTWIMAHPEEHLSSHQEKQFLTLVSRRAAHKPIAYLIGTKEFRGLSFRVNKHVLIPRPETEDMIDLVVGAHGVRPSPASPGRVDAVHPYNNSHTVIWDVGTGSGALAVSAKHLFPETTVIASDISKRGLRVAAQNANNLLGSHHSLSFFQGSLLSKNIQASILEKQSKTLIVLANLPYLPFSDRTLLQKDVIDFEPHQALFTQQDGNALILKLLKQLRLFTKKHSLHLRAIFEFDPPQAETLRQEAHKQFPNASVTLHKDACGRWRFLDITSPPDTHPSTS